MGNHAIAVASTGRWARVRSFLLHEFREMLPPTIFFFIGFNLILFSKRLLLADYLIQFSGFMLATTSALVVGKTVLVANMMPFLRRFDHAPLVQPVLFKTAVYTLLVFVVRLLEALIHYLIQSGILGGGGFLHQLLGSFRWDHFIVVQMWIFVLFLVYVTASELDDMLGDGELFKIFFTRRSPYRPGYLPGDCAPARSVHGAPWRAPCRPGSTAMGPGSARAAAPRAPRPHPVPAPGW